MKFESGTRRRAIEYEKDWVERWKKAKTFEKSIEQRPIENSYVFYDGPPFITGVPHHGTLLSSIVKDAVPRYWTMKGKRVERVWGWDCHGLPAENFVEKQLVITDRRQIITRPNQEAPHDKEGNVLPTISLEKYIETARDSMVANSETWETVVDQVGRWVDFKGAYRTMDKDFMESVWWAFKQLYDAGKIYEGAKVLMYDTKFATPVSKNEVTMDNDAYQTVTDPSAYVKFKSLTRDAYYLAWTTTPWTLPGNMALAVNPDIQYSKVRLDDGRQFILAKKLIATALKDESGQPLHYEEVETITGKELVGDSYAPLFVGDESRPLVDSKNFTKDYFEFNTDNSHHVWAADFVEDEAGTGVVHIAPAYGEDDFNLAREKRIPPIDVIDEDGYYLEEVAARLREIGVRGSGESNDINVWEANKFIAKCLKEQGAIEYIEYIQHEYPFNPRSQQRIMYRAIPSWFFDVQGSKPLMLEQNENITWFPEHLKHGRFQKNIEQAPDWNLSRDRFWATAMPVWKGDRGTVKVVGSYAELKELSGVELEDYHRPWVDGIAFEIEGEVFTRIDKVLDCWFESGSMPFAQLHYPFENQEKFQKNYPADFIVEYVGQVRAWFYYVHVVNTELANLGAFGECVTKNAFKNVITTGVLAGNDGRKMSKSLGNFTDPTELMEKFSADSLRFLLLSSPLLNGEDFSLQDKDVGDVARKLTMIWNMYDFFTMYAEVDGWEFDPNAPFALNPDDVTNPLDKWIISRLHQLNTEVTRHMDTYNVPDAMNPILPFIEDASNWFVRRSRRRFWKSEDDGDKADAYRTLHYVLLKLSVIIAPFTPFLAEELYQKMGGGSESVHLLDWPMNSAVDDHVMNEMEMVRDYVNQGLSLRAKAGLKVRQPLASVTVPKLGEHVDFEAILTDELNVKKVLVGDAVALDEQITPELKREGLMREVVRFVQNARKNAGLSVDDRIILTLSTIDDVLREAIDEHIATIKAEALVVEVAQIEGGHNESVKVEGRELDIHLRKASD